ncbi:DUF2293 domain-containing protein [Nocardia pseudobrasiliensis]|uniref:DUF2293 domain-containing protein n=1 Tax=Nocardia pseudobrasiliensis TaxID=45979 RepID=A0A370I2N2_9NOCA|nr:DUF2293 domain-containing protein [Nocardia pseudobrasiliensis]RDI64995.1 hypothetical protein DFR76_107373 [Nocardia pseudobrasiliensis]
MSSLRQRVVEAAEAALAQRKYVSAVEVFTRLRWARAAEIERWRHGQVDSLEQVLAVDGSRMRDAADLLGRWAREQGLTAGSAAYVSGGRDREELRFAEDGDDEIFRIHWLSPQLTPARREQVLQRQNKAPDLMVIEAAEPWTCVECAETGPRFISSGAGPLCLTCSDLDHLEFLPAGDAALSRRAKKESRLAAIVVTYNKRRKRYQRLGILIEGAALARAEEQCLADEDARTRRRDRDRIRRAAQDIEFTARMAEEIRRLFPHCPPDRATEIADHAAVRGSGRVGRSAAAKLLSPEALTLAVIASIRHQDTPYDHLLMTGTPRTQARTQIRPTVDQVLNSWRG